MGELGDGTGTDYPTGIDTNSTQESVSTTVRAAVPNDMGNAIVAIENELGTNPSRDLANVGAFLDVEHNTNGTHDTSKVGMLAGTQTFTGAKTFSNTTIVSGALNATSTLTVTGATTLNGNATIGDASTDTLTINSDITLSTWPSFSVHKNGSDQGSITASDTLITWSTELFDTNSNFASNRFTPTIAGKYLLSVCLHFNSVADADVFIVKLYKNTGVHKQVQNVAASGANHTVNLTAVVDANGSSDYFEIYGFYNPSPGVVEGTASQTFWTGCRIG